MNTETNARKKAARRGLVLCGLAEEETRLVYGPMPIRIVIGPEVFFICLSFSHLHQSLSIAQA